MHKYYLKYSIFTFIGILLIGGAYVWLVPLVRDGGTSGNFNSSVSVVPASRQEAKSQKKLEPPQIPTSSDMKREEIPDAPTREERVRMLEERYARAKAQIQPLSSEDVSKALLDAMRSGDNTTFNTATTELINRGKMGDTTAIESIQSALNQATPREREWLVWEVLGHITTDASLRVLLELLDTSSNDEIRDAALTSIAKIGKYYRLDPPKNVSPQTLSSILEEYFDTIPKSDKQRLRSVSSGLIDLGTLSGKAKAVEFVE